MCFMSLYWHISDGLDFEKRKMKMRLKYVMVRNRFLFLVIDQIF